MAGHASFPPLEFRLEVVLDSPLTTPCLVTPSAHSTLRDNPALVMTFLNPPFPVAQLMEFQVGETLGISASVVMNDTCYEPGDTFNIVHDFDVTLVVRSYVDVVIAVPVSSYMVGDISPNHLDTFHAFPSCYHY